MQCHLNSEQPLRFYKIKTIAPMVRWFLSCLCSGKLPASLKTPSAGGSYPRPSERWSRACRGPCPALS